MNIKTLKEHVTYFSEEFQYKAKHEEDVVVGGRILDIISPVDKDYPMFICLLDDKVGTSHVFVPENMMAAHKEELQIGQDVLLEGFVSIITREVKKEILKDISIFAYGMKDITKVGDTI